jgi:glycosyltransferase involved in cell wall biosynthesis
MNENDVSLSVILPVYNAMPYLPIAVLHVMQQDLDGRSLQLVCADDASKDGSFEFLLELAALLAAKIVYLDSSLPDNVNKSVTTLNPALVKELRAEETSDHPSFAAPPEEIQQMHEKPLTPQDVAQKCRKEHVLTIVTYSDRINRGQGSTMTVCLAQCRAPLIAQMESDDERERMDAYKLMMLALQEHPDWDGVSCLTKCIGWERPGMQRYVDWQNKLRTPQVGHIPCAHTPSSQKHESPDTICAGDAKGKVHRNSSPSPDRNVQEGSRTRGRHITAPC